MELQKLIIDRSGLANAVKKARGERTQQQVAHDLGVSQAAISQAEQDVDQSLDSLRIKIIEKYSNYKVEGPFTQFHLIKVEK